MASDEEKKKKSRGLVNAWKRFKAALPRIRQLSSIVLSKFGRDFCFQRAGSLAYSTVMSLVPIVTLSLSILTSFTFFNGVQERIKQTVIQHFIPSQAQLIQGYIEEFSKNLSSLNAVSIIAFLLLGVFLLINLENHLNAIWKVKKRRNFFQAIANYWGVLTLGPLLIGVSFYVTSSFSGHSLIDKNPVLSIMSSFSMNLVFMFVLFYLMPNFPVKFRPALGGALFSGIFYEVLKYIFTAFTANFGNPQFQIYGSFAVLPFFLVWIFTVWVIILIGAEISYFIQFPPLVDEEKLNTKKLFAEELAVYIQVIKEYLAETEVINQSVIHQTLKDLQPYEIVHALNVLEENNFIIKTDKRGYIPYSDPCQQNLGKVMTILLGIENTAIYSEEVKSIIRRLQDKIQTDFKDELTTICPKK